MKRTYKKLLVVMLFSIFFTLVTSCNNSFSSEKYSITYELNGGTLKNTINSYDGSKDVILHSPSKESDHFMGWYLTEDFSGNPVEMIKKGESGDKVFYAKWYKDTITSTSKSVLNKIGFNGNGCDFVIKVDSISECNPFHKSYIKEDRVLKQMHLKAVESAYNIDIKYVPYDDAEVFGLARCSSIANSYRDGTYLKNDIYVVDIMSQWITTLIPGYILADLYSMAMETGYFENIGYEQDGGVNYLTSYHKKVYGYNPNSIRPDYFLYYNIDKVKSLGVEDPAELWFKGEWNWSKFESWVEQASLKLGEDEYVIDCGYAEFSIGAASAIGSWMVDYKGKVGLTKNPVVNLFKKMQSLYQNGYWNHERGLEEVSTSFTSGKSLIHSGSISYVDNQKRFGLNSGLEFSIGVVPYPTENNQKIIILTEPIQDEYGNKTEPILNRNNETLKTSKGEVVYGVDYINTTYNIPITGTSCYGFMNHPNPSSGITPEVAFNIMYDLESNIIDYYLFENMSNDEKYEYYLKQKFNSKLDIDVIMSVQDKAFLYIELMEAASIYLASGTRLGTINYWSLAKDLVTGSDDPKTVLDEICPIYESVYGMLG